MCIIVPELPIVADEHDIVSRRESKALEVPVPFLRGVASREAAHGVKAGHAEIRARVDYCHMSIAGNRHANGRRSLNHIADRVKQLPIKVVHLQENRGVRIFRRNWFSGLSPSSEPTR